MQKALQKVMMLAFLLWAGTSWAITQKDGVYQIKTPVDFKAFADMINNGETNINAVLTADIDFTGYNMSIGNSNANTYKGTLDGQGHKITIKREGGNGLGLFEYCGGTIKNLIVDGEINSNGEHNGGIVGDARQGLRIENCISYVNITSTRDTNIGSGGILGNVGGADTKLINCIYAGKIKANDRVGGFVGWYDDPNNVIENCLMIGEVDVTNFGDLSSGNNELASNVLCRYGTHPIRCSIRNTYYVKQAGVPETFYVGRLGEVMGDSNGEDNTNNMTQGAFEVTKAQVEGGEVCYKMNKNAGGNTFTQNIGSDVHPLPFDTHSAVSEVNGIYCNVDENGYICIGTAGQFKTFADMINNGQTEINAVLTADIDFTGYNMSIGNSNANTYKGTLDGQGHRITIRRDGGNGMGLFEYCGGTIRNLIVDGEINSNGEHNGGIVSDARQGLLIENCISYVNITSTRDTNIGSGGILGNVGGADTKLINCIYAGKIKANDRVGGFVGWYDDPNNIIENCLMIGEVDVANFGDLSTGNNELASNVLCRYGTHPIRCSIRNSYYLRQAGVPETFYVGRLGEVMGDSNGEDNTSNMTQGAFEVSKEQLEGGEVCYKMNEKAGEGNSFTQTIGADKFPVPFATQSPVFYVDGKYSNTDENGFLYISSASQFKAYADRINNGETAINAKLTADIDFTGYNMSIGNSNEHTYKGTLDGQGHKITIKREGGNGLGLFEYCGGTIRNLIVDGEINSTGEHNGGIVGDARQGLHIENCISYVNITSTRDGNVGSGGILGNVGGADTKLINCIYAGKIKGKDRIGGFVGWYDDPNNEITNCLMIGEVEVEDYGHMDPNIGNEIASNVICRYGVHPIRCTISNTYYVRQEGVSDLFYVGRANEVMGSSNGEDNFNNMTQGAFEVTWDQVRSGEVCYKLNGKQEEINFWQVIGQDAIPLPFEKEDAQVYLKDGTYTNSDAYMIATAAEFKAFADLINNGQTEINAKLTADIDFTGYNMSIGNSNANTYKGTFDGQGHKITIKREGGNGLGLFEYCGGTIRNLIVDGEINSNGEHNGGIVGDARQGLRIENCISYVNITSTRDTNIGSGGILGNVGGADTKLINCIYAGKIKANDRVGGFVGWYDDPNNVIENCLMIGEVDVANFGDLSSGNNELASNVLCRYGTHPIRCSIRNSYYLRQAGVPETFYVGRLGEVMGDSNGEDNTNNMTQGAFGVTQEQLASGEVTFALNNNQQEIAFYQTIGTDEVPTILSNGHKRVYANGEVKCNGIKYGEATYSNVAPNLIDAHQFVDGICTVCGATEGETELFIDENGYYVIASAAQFKQFCDLVNDKNMIEAKVRLADDIDLTDEKYAKTRLSSFAGEFDGQGHSITTAWKLTGAAGLVAALRGEVHDVIMRGTMINSQSYMGGIAGSTIGARIRNCVVETEITSTYNGHNGSVEGGGFIGRNEGSNTLVENCVFSGKLIQGEADDANLQACGGIQGNNRGTIIIRNCIVTGSVEARSTDAATFARDGQATTTNCYYLNGFPGGTFGDCTQMTAEQFSTGELTYKLNGGEIDPDKVVWRQNTYTYEPSIPMPTGGDAYGIVYRLENGRYMGVYDEASLKEFQEIFDIAENEYAANVEANAEAVDAYLPFIEELTSMTDYKKFWYAYIAFNQKKQILVDNVNAYITLFKRAEDAKAYLEENELIGEAAEILKTYVNDYVEPGDQFNNGSVVYIHENYQLGTEAVRGEITYLNSLFGKAIGDGYKAGTDITLLLTNPDLSDGFNGWQGYGGTNTYSTLDPAVREAWDCTLDRHQQITGLKNGIYELQMNALFRPADDNYNLNYAAYLYAYSGNAKNWVPIMGISEGALPASEARPGENCYIVNINNHPYDNELQFEVEGDIYYVPNSVDGASIAFKGGRYQNRILVNVTDGTLNLGVYVPGTGASRDWCPFGGTKLIYQGELGEPTATASLTDVLDGMVARAETLIAYQGETVNYIAKAGFSQQEKNELQACIDAYGTAESDAAMYEVVKRFSAVFQSIQQTKQDYKRMFLYSNALLDAASNLSRASVIEQSEMTKIFGIIDDIGYGFESGTPTPEEARNMDFFDGVDFVPAQVDGIYQIGSISQFAVFAEFVRQIDNNLSAKQTADIAGVSYDMGLTNFGGTYDGDFHTLTVNINTDQEHAAPFRHIQNNAVVKNLVVRGTIDTGAKFAGGIVGEARDNANILNCESHVVINSTVNGDGTHGGIIGIASGTGTIRVTNALFAGSINGDQTTCCAGICGWADSDRNIISNCLVVGDITTNTEGCATFSRNPDNFSVVNSYYKDGFLELQDSNKGTKVTASQLTSGEMAYRLNGNKQGQGVAWYQNVGTDAYPTIVPNDQYIVYMYEDGTFSNVPTAIEDIAVDNRESTAIYDLTGRRVEKARKGLYIINGKKVLFK